jgi:tetratricopeptide (TPR) repeat protein
VYFELSRGKSVIDAAFSARKEMAQGGSLEWYVLRLFSDGTPLIPLVEEGQKARPRSRDIQYIYLGNGQVKVLTEGFVGRRRQIQRGIRWLRGQTGKVGLLLHGTGGLGKSCLAGRLCERFKDSNLIIVHGELNALTFQEALKDAFIRAHDQEEILDSLGEEVQEMCHDGAVEYYRELLSSSEDYEPVYASELIDHAVQCGMQDLAVWIYWMYGEKHPSVATRLNNLGSAWDSLGDSRKAVECVEKAHQIFHEILGPDHPYTISTKKSLHYLKDSLSSDQV